MVLVRKAIAASTIKALEKNNFAHFPLQVTVFDNVKHVVLHTLRGVCLQLRISHITTMPCYWHASYIEHLNWNLRPALNVYHSTSQTSCDEELVWLQLAFNTATPEAMWATSFKIIFLFQADPLPLNKRSFHELLPYRHSPVDLRCKWNAFCMSLWKVVNKWNEYTMWVAPYVCSKSGGWLGSIPIHWAMQGFRALLSILFSRIGNLRLTH